MNILEDRSILLYGEQKVGKTRFALAARENHLYIAVEDRFKRLESLINTKLPKDGYIKTIGEYQEIQQEVGRLIESDKPNPDVIIIDTIDSLVGLMEDDALRKYNAIGTEFYNEVKKMFRLMVLPFLKHLKRVEIPTILISHACSIDVEGKNKTVPQCGTPAIMKMLRGHVDDIWYAKIVKEDRYLQVVGTELALASIDHKLNAKTKSYPKTRISYPLDWDEFEKEMIKVCQ